jgi:hypothetical protein
MSLHPRTGPLTILHQLHEPVLGDNLGDSAAAPRHAEREGTGGTRAAPGFERISLQRSRHEGLGGEAGKDQVGCSLGAGPVILVAGCCHSDSAGRHRNVTGPQLAS